MAAGPVVREMHLFKRDSAFVWAFFIGAAVIFVVKMVATGQPIIGGFVASAVGIIVMFLYKGGQSQIRPKSEYPSLGDEIYYLGLLYTLTSLCAALVSLFLLFGDDQSLEERTNEMIGSFGIALITTMAGIVIRMTLQRQAAESQDTIIRIPASGINPDDVYASIDLERYAMELRKQLNDSTNAFVAHANQAILQSKTVHSHMDEMMQTFHEGLRKKADEGLKVLNSIYEDVLEEIKKVNQWGDVWGEGIQSILGRLENQMQALDQTLDHIRGGSVDVGTNLESIGVQAGLVTEKFSGMAKDLSATEEHVNNARRIETELQEVCNGLSQLKTMLQSEVPQLSDALKEATLSFEEAKRNKGIWGRLFD